MTTATAPQPTVTATTSLPPGPSIPKPALIARFLFQPTSFLDSCQRRYGDYFTLDLPNRTSVLTSDPEAVKTVFTADPDHLLAGKNNSILQPILGDRSVLLLDGREHLRQRRLLLPPFHGERMQGYAETMREVADRGIEGLPRNRPFAAQPAMQAITLEVILRTVFGLSDAERVEQVGAPLRRLLDATASQPRLFALQLTSSENPHRLSPWGRFNALVAEADRVVYEEIASRRGEADGEHTDVLSLLLAARDEQGRPLTDLELRDELMTLLLAGHETTATALAWTLERLVRSPAVLERLVAEHRAGDTTYLDATIKEALRLRPVVPAVGRYLPLRLRSVPTPCPPTSTSTSRSTSSIAAPISIPSPTPSGPSASWGARPAPMSGFPSAAASAAASAPASPCSRCGSSSGLCSTRRRFGPVMNAMSASAAAPSPSSPAAAPASPWGRGEPSRSGCGACQS